MTGKVTDFASLSNFFSRLASGDHRSLLNEYTSAPTSTPTTCAVEAKTSLGKFVVPSPHFLPATNTFWTAAPREKTSGIHASATPTGRDDQCLPLKLMVDGFHNLADFAQIVADVLIESQNKFQPLPEELRRKKAVDLTAGAGDLEASLRAIKKRKMVSARRLATNDGCGETGVTSEGASKGSLMSRVSSTDKWSSSPSRRGLASLVIPDSNFSPNTTHTPGHEEDPSPYDEQVVLDFVRELCEKKHANRKQRLQAHEVDNMSPSSSASSTQTTFSGDGVAEVANNADKKPRMKRRLST